MKTKLIITNTLCLLLLLPLAESQQEGVKGGEAGAAPPIAIRPNDVDLGHPETEMWQREIGQFNAMLRNLVETADLPDKEELKKEIESRSGRAEVLTDGRGGVVDFNAAKGTIQHEANELIGSGGPHIDWEFELAGDSRVNDDKSTWFAPKIAQIVNDGDGKKEQFRFFIRIEKTDAGPFKAGDRIRIRATIDNFSCFTGQYRDARGLVAIYYLEDYPNPFFELRLDEAEVTLLEPETSESGPRD